MDETQRDYAKSKMSDMKDYILYGSIYEMSRTGKSMETESKLTIDGRRAERSDHGISFWGDRNVLDYGGGHILL